MIIIKQWAIQVQNAWYKILGVIEENRLFPSTHHYEYTTKAGLRLSSLKESFDHILPKFPKPFYHSYPQFLLTSFCTSILEFYFQEYNYDIRWMDEVKCYILNVKSPTRNVFYLLTV